MQWDGPECIWMSCVQPKISKNNSPTSPSRNRGTRWASLSCDQTRPPFCFVMTYQWRRIEGNAVPEEKYKDGSTNKDLNENMDNMREDPDRPVSPVFSCLSMKTDRSKDYPLNFKHGDLPQEKGMQSEEVVCDFCEIKAVTLCQTCTQNYCQTHIKKHYTLPKLKKHKLVKLTEGLEDGFCQEHQRPVEVFCRTDQMLICSLCSVKKHQGHDTIHVESINFDGDQYQTPTSYSDLSSPEKIQVVLLSSDSVSLSWSPPQGVEGPNTFRVTWECGWEEMSSRVKGHHLEINSLNPEHKQEKTICSVFPDLATL
ncbi:hypothetical protein UPYG_G00047120 [Umbra pygmaea]|uniref:B box-type domain-containing protein n=1 Tax=Umbra pygmaea TaxID=75934 RepID=A0ABD0XR73_UMBPY